MRNKFESKIRKILNAPLHEKGRIYFLFFSVFIAAAFIVSLIAKYRRLKSYKKYYELIPETNTNKQINIICVGNIIIGGVGKSPVVQNIAQFFLENGYVVAIAARGIGSKIKKCYIVNNDLSSNLSGLSDENREHFELLKYRSVEGGLFYILQDPSRASSLQFFAKELERKNIGFEKSVFIMDDGLQHFQCPHGINICLWSTSLLNQSPFYCLPVGPYREGFGIKSFQTLLNTFDYRFWSRAKKQNYEKYKSEILTALNKFSLLPSEKDIIVTYDILCWEVEEINLSYRLKSIISKNDAISKIKNFDEVVTIVGIANPNAFESDMDWLLHDKKVYSQFLGDHAFLSRKYIPLISNAKVVIFTAKDFFRWCEIDYFRIAIKSKIVFVCSIDVELQTFYGKKLDFRVC